MSNAARKQLGLDSELLRNKQKNEHLPSHVLHLGQDVMLQDTTSKQCFQLLLQACAHNQEVTRLQQGKVSPIRIHSTLEAIHTTKQEE